MCKEEFYPNHPEKCDNYIAAINRQEDYRIYLGEDQVYLRAGGQYSDGKDSEANDPALILIYRQLRYWFPDAFP
jgi:hypothetical protein